MDHNFISASNERNTVKEIPITGEHAVLTDDVISRLACAGQDIKRVFNNKDQDIEWVYMRRQIYIVQSRHYLTGGQSMLVNPGRSGI